MRFVKENKRYFAKLCLYKVKYKQITRYTLAYRVNKNYNIDLPENDKDMKNRFEQLTSELLMVLIIVDIMKPPKFLFFIFRIIENEVFYS